MKTERKYIKAINFDLDTNSLRTYFPTYTQAYVVLGKELKRQGFEHRQGSGYVSETKITNAEVYQRIATIAQNNPWLANCAKEFDVTNVPSTIWSLKSALQGKPYNSSSIVKKSTLTAKPKTSGSSARRTSRPASSSGKDERGH